MSLNFDSIAIMKRKGSKKQETSLTKKDLKSALKEQSNDFKRYVGAVSEDFQHKTAAIAEQYISIKEDVSTLKEDVSTIKEDVSSLKKTQETHTEMIGKLMMDMTIIKENVEFIKSGLKKKVDQEEFDALVRRVILLEKQKR